MDSLHNAGLQQPGPHERVLEAKPFSYANILGPELVLGITDRCYRARERKILTMSAAIIPAAPSSALYSRCFKYKSKENPAGGSLLGSGVSRGNILGTRRA